MPATPSAQILLDHRVRIEDVLYLPGALSDGYTEQFGDFADSLPSDHSHPLLLALPELIKFADADDDVDAGEVAQAIRKDHAEGFLILAATPFRKREGEKVVCSWGMVHTSWLYAADQNAIIVNSIAWAAAVAAQDLNAAVTA